MSEHFDPICRIFQEQQANRWKVAQTSAAERIAKLRQLRNALWNRRPELHKALHDDFGKNPAEADLTEVLPIVAEINHTIRHLAEWMAPIRVRAPKLLLGTASEIRYEPKGLVLILAPWNYPVNLLINPLVAALAAGNCAIAKPSSKVPHTSRFLKAMFDELFPANEVALIEGSSALADELLQLRFDHIVFTGSPRVGKTVMAAAAKHLTAVTLELGGKSPVIVDATADIPKAAERILWGKFLNAGQTCIAPDYLFIHEDRQAEFLAAARQVLEKRFGADSSARQANSSYCRLVSAGHLEGLLQILNASVESGAQIEFGGLADRAERYLEPTLLSGVKVDSPIMQEEIFGPILPILTFRDLDAPIRFIQSREKPLALYIFSRKQAHIDALLKSTTAGGTCINTVILQIANPDLPFGGVGNSGMGSYHGFAGFRSLSHERSVLRQGAIDTLQLFYPPYTERLARLIRMAAKHLA